MISTELSTRSNFLFAPDIGIFVRDDIYVQFGLDSTRAAIVKTTNARRLAGLIRAAQHGPPMDKEGWERVFIAAGMPLLTARSLFYDLLDFGIMYPQRKPAQVVLVGESALARHIRAMCEDRGLSVRQPHKVERLRSYLSDSDNNTVVLVADQLHRTPAVAQALHDLPSASSWIPLSIVDSRGFIGPLRIHGYGPCPMCFELRRLEIDPSWSVLTRQLQEAEVRSDPQVIASVTARVAAILDWLLGHSVAQQRGYHPGDFFDIDVYGTSAKDTLGKHPLCPECFAKQTG